MTIQDFNFANDMPHKSVLSDDGRLREEHWKGDFRHRDGGPALIERCPKTGIVVREEYWQEGVRHRPEGPAVIARDSRTGHMILEEYFVNGDLRGRRLTPPQTHIPGICIHLPRPPIR